MNDARVMCRGMNSILIYVSHEVLRDYFPVSFHVSQSHAALLSVDVWGSVFWLVVAAALYHKNVFVAI